MSAQGGAGPRRARRRLAIEAPALVALYRASADCSGADDFELEIGLPNGQERRERIHVMVTKSSSAGEGI